MAIKFFIVPFEKPSRRLPWSCRRHRLFFLRSSPGPFLPLKMTTTTKKKRMEPEPERELELEQAMAMVTVAL